MCRKRIDDVETTGESLLWDKRRGRPVDCLRGIRHEGGVKSVQALVWNVGTCCHLSAYSGHFDFGIIRPKTSHVGAADYANTAPIQIRIYDDKLILWNPAILPLGWTRETLLDPQRIPLPPARAGCDREAEH